ncbi:hypothetical protein [Nocardia nepalensis]|uniref:hypothetical protein n=1 Tax=Nocardia nepalensis TaxID=3375448 RepID=UPI003B6795EA
MSSQLLTRAETTKLARLLDISDPAQLHFLAELPPEAIRAFRERATDLLFGPESVISQRVSATRCSTRCSKRSANSTPGRPCCR